MTIPVPPFAVQQDFARKAPQLASLMKLQKIEADKADHAFLALLSRVFSGDHTASAPTEEAAVA